MKTEEITDGRLIIKDREQLKLIEAFMGYADGYLSEVLTWNDIIPVVEKIESIAPYRVVIDINECRIIADKRFKVHTIKKINSVWQCVVQFIKWYSSKTSAQ